MQPIQRFLSRFLATSILLTAPMLGEAKPVTVTFIHFNDLHAHLVTHPDLVPDGPPGQPTDKTKIVERGGLARTATLIKRIRRDNPNSVLMNIGDTFHGGVEALFTNGNAVAAPLNALGIDIGVPGNWDYAYGPMVTRLRYADLGPLERRMLSRVNGMLTPTGDIKRPNFPNLAANVTFTMPFWKAGKPFLPPSMIKEIGGVQVGFIGISSDIVPRMHPMLAMGLKFLEGEDNYRNLIDRFAKALRDNGAQVVVVMSELGLQKDYRLAQVIDPGLVDVFFSAHTHEAVFTPLTSKSGAYVVEAGNDGYLGRMDITVDHGKVVSRKWKLLIVDKSIPEDKEVKRLVEEARAPFLVTHPNIKLPMMFSDQVLDKPINTVVGYVKGPLDRRNALESTFNAAFAEMLRQKGKTQLSITPGFRFDSVIEPGNVPLEDNTVAMGPITIEDVYRYFPVSYTISTGEVTGERLRSIMEEGLNSVFSPNVFEQAGGWFEGFGGLKATVDLSRSKGSRVLDLKLLDGKPILDSDLLTVTGCTRPFDDDTTLCSYKGFTNVKGLINPDTDKPWTVADIFVDALSHGGLPLVHGKHIIDTNDTALWPTIPYVQPLTGVSK